MAKTKEELNELKEEIETLSQKLGELSDEEMEEVTGGSGVLDFYKKIGEGIKNIGKKVLPIVSDPTK